MALEQREILLGRNAKLWYQTIPNITEANPPASWFVAAKEAATVSGVGVSVESEIEDFTPRAGTNNDFLNNIQLRHSIQINITMPWDVKAGFLKDCIAANSIRSAISVAVVDKDEADNIGVAGNFWIGISYSQPISGIQEAQIALIPFNNIQWVSGLYIAPPDPEPEPEP